MGKNWARTGIPFLVLVIGGAAGLTQFSKVKYQYGLKRYNRVDLEEAGLKMKKPEEVTVEKELEKLESLDIDTWQNIRGPRPWEEDNPSNILIEKRTEAALQKKQLKL